MTQESLGRVRIFVPGAMLFLVVPPLFFSELAGETLLERLSSVNAFTDSIAVLVLGSLYYIFEVRKIIWRRTVGTTINQNINNTLLDAFQQDPVVIANQEELRHGRTLLNIFYKHIDNDASLTKKADRVRLNGAFLSSAADLEIIAAFGAVAHSFAFSFTDRIHQAGFAVVLAILFALSHVLVVPRLTKRHVELSNDQLEFMIQHHREAVRADIRRATGAD